MDVYKGKIAKSEKKTHFQMKVYKAKQGRGIVNSIINKLPFELHIPSYQYCGPGTNLKKRLNRNDPGINELDRACKAHDIAYSQSNTVTDRNRADEILANKAWQRFKSSDASLGERAAALGVSGIMKTKSAIGAGVKIQRRRKKSNQKRRKAGLGIRFKRSASTQKAALNAAVRNAKSVLRIHKPTSIADASILALKAAKAAVNTHKIYGKPNGELPRVIPVPKIGGILPLIPVFAGLSALGALMGGSAGIASAVNSASKAKKEYNELKRHNESMEAIALGNTRKGGTGLFLKPYKNGLGLYLTPYSKNMH